MKLSEELKTYEAHRQTLLATAKGQYALIKGSELIDTFFSREDALKRGFQEYGNEPFLVKQIVDLEIPINFVSYHVDLLDVPSFTLSIGDIRSTGPVLDVFVMPSALLVQALAKSGQPIPQPVRMTAMVDTGAGVTAINPEIVAQLGLSPTGTGTITTPSTHEPVAVNRYSVDISFHNNAIVHEVDVVEAPLMGVEIKGLIGRDILSRAVLVYIGQANQFTLSL